MTYEEEIRPYRETIDRLNEEIIERIADRHEAAIAIAKIKQNHGKPIVDKKREQAILNKIREKAHENGINSDALESIFKEIIKLCTEAEETQ